MGQIDQNKARFTDFTDHVELVELGRPYSVNVEIPIDSFLLKKTKILKLECNKLERRSRMLYTTKLSPSLSSPVSLNQETMKAQTTSNDLNQRRHLQTICDDGAGEIGSQHHPVTVFCPLQASDDNFGVGEGLQVTEYQRRHLLKIFLQQPQITDWVVNESLFVPATQVIYVSPRENVRPSRNNNCRR